MFRLAPPAAARLSPECLHVVEQFLAALPPFTRRAVERVRLFGPQVRGYEPEAAFDVLVVAHARSLEMKTALAIATTAAEEGGQYDVRATLVTPDEWEAASGDTARTVANARREGLDLWTTPAPALAAAS